MREEHGHRRRELRRRLRGAQRGSPLLPKVFPRLVSAQIQSVDGQFKVPSHQTQFRERGPRLTLSHERANEVNHPRLSSPVVRGDFQKP